jgi:hypothetical protein
MNDRPAPAGDVDDGDARARHRRAWDLVPWVVAGSATPAESRGVLDHARDCEECAAEIAFHRAVRDGMALPSVDAEAETRAADAAWAAMALRLDAEAALAEAPPVPAAASGASAGSAPAHPAVAMPRPAANAVRWLAAAVVVQAVGLAAMAGVLAWRTPAESAFETLSEAPAAPGGRDVGVQLVFAPEVTLGEIGTRLAAVGWQLAEVSADGLRYVAVPGGTQALPPVQALAAWRGQPGVLLAEPMPPPAAPRR